MTTRLSIFLVLVLSLSPIPAPSLCAAAPQKPNILFIAIDDLNDWGLAALNGRKAVRTPNLDRLAARGMLFVNAHCAAPACNPSRTAILTGVAPHRSGVYTNSHDWRVNERLKDAATLPEYFRRHGYTAVGGGKIFHALEWIDGPSDGFNDAKCWDHFFPSINRQIPSRLYPAETPVVKGKGAPRPLVYFDWSPLDEPVEKMPDHKTVDWAIGELQKPHDKPFFQAVGLFRPHIPWYVPRQFFDLYPLDEIELPYVKPGWREKLPPAAQVSGEVRRRWHRWVVENDQWKNAVQGYLASISYCDYELGRLIEALDRSPAAANTVVVLWTDHGFHLGDKDTWEKFTLWSESTRVPLIVVAPGVTQPGSTCARPASLLDIYPTLLELAGLPPNAKNDGMSLVPWLKNPALPRERPAIITNERDNHAVRNDRYHYVRYANGEEELYDMVGDEGQWNNLAGDPNHAAAKAELMKWLPRENAPVQGRAPKKKDKGTGNGREGGSPEPSTPEALLKTLDPFYTRHVVADGLLIVGSAKPSEYALREVAYLAQTMLANRPDVLKKLGEMRMYVCVMAYNEMQTDLPECRRMSLWWAKRARGLGGRPVSCGEENQLGFEGDPYQGENIFIHEFAHGLEGAFGGLDDQFNTRLRTLYQKAKETGRFRGYGLNNTAEFWAEGVQSWFNCNRNGGLEVRGTDGGRLCQINTREQLKEHLPEFAELLDEAFGQNKWVYVPVRKRLDQPHLRGFDPAKAPTFRWPPHVIEAYNRLEAERVKKEREQGEKGAKK